MMSRRANVLIALTIGAMGLVRAQNPIDAPILVKEERVMAGTYFDWGIATQHLASNLHRDNGIGVGGEALFKVRSRSPVWAGLGVHSFAFDKYKYRYSQTVDGIFYNFLDRTASRVFMAHAVVRFQPEVHSVIQPYLQGSLGVHWFFTNTKIQDADTDEYVDRINENRDAVLGFGIHGGIHIVPPRLPYLRGDIRFGYFRNASIEYYRYNPELSGQFAIDSFEKKESAVDLLGVHIGVVIMISGE